MIITEHASEQMAKRGISRASVVATIAHGRKIPTDIPHIIRHVLKGLFVVEDIRTGAVVTTFHDDGGVRKSKKKRRKGRHGPAQ